MDSRRGDIETRLFQQLHALMDGIRYREHIMQLKFRYVVVKNDIPPGAEKFVNTRQEAIV